MEPLGPPAAVLEVYIGKCRVFSSGNYQITACSGSYVSISEARRLQSEGTVLSVVLWRTGDYFTLHPAPQGFVAWGLFFARVSSSGG